MHCARERQPVHQFATGRPEEAGGADRAHGGDNGSIDSCRLWPAALPGRSPH